MKPGTGPAVTGSVISCYAGFDIHSTFSALGQFIGIVSGVASIAWVIYQFMQTRKAK